MANIEIRQMRPDDEHAVREVVCKEFFRGEPIGRALGLLGEQDGKMWFDVTFPQSVRDGVSTVAVDVETGNIVGVRLTVILHKDEPEPEYFSKDDPKTRNLAMVYDEILTLGYKGVDLFAEYSVDKFANFRGVCVVPKYQRQGIGGKLVAKSLDLIREKKVPLVTVEASSQFSGRVFQRHGFEQIAQYNYDSMMFDGKPLPMTDELEYHKAITFYVKVM